MKIKNLAMLAGASLLVTACGCITEPADMNGQAAYFEYASSEITSDSENNLLGQALYMKNHPETEIQVAGNCDERGSTEYNLALGARRANAAKAVMVQDGVEADRISTISYGKERPAVKGTGEEVWKWNRNATTTVK